MKYRRGFFSKIFIFAGCLFIAFALGLTVYNVYDQGEAQKSSEIALNELEKSIPEKDDNAKKEKPLYKINPNIEMPVKKIDGVDYIGMLYIESLDLKLPIASEWSYQRLKKAPCRYVGSAYKGDLVLAAHNYNVHFGRIDELPINSKIIFTDVEGNKFVYVVLGNEVLHPTDIDDMIDSSMSDLTLFTCTLGGRTRFTVRCEEVQ